MNDILQAVLETTEDGPLPFHGELVVEAIDGGMVSLDEADIMEDILIEAFEAEVVRAAAASRSIDRQQLELIDEALSAGDYELALDIGASILADAGVDESVIAEFKRGFKTTAGQRARMMRARKRAKTGAQRMALRARRMAARKSSARMKRRAYVKRNKVRLAKRRAQLMSSEMPPVGESFVIPTELAAQKVEEGMMFVVLADGYEPYFTATQEEANEIADTVEGASIHTLDIDVIEEAKRRSQKPAKKAAMPADAEMMEKDCYSEMDDEEEYDDEEEMDESLDESAVEQLAQEVASFIQQNPMVTYGELATRFKIGRDVAQQAMLHAGKVAGTRGEDAGWMMLAKEILAHRVQHTTGTKQAPAAMAMEMPQDEFRMESLDEAKRKPKPKMVPSKGNKAGATKVAMKPLPKAKLKGQAGAIPSDHAPDNAGNAPMESAHDESELVEVTTPVSNQDRLLAVATEHGISADAKLTIEGEVITLFVPASKAQAIRQALTV